MRTLAGALAIVGSLGVVGCGEDSPPSTAVPRAPTESVEERFAEERFFRSPDEFLSADRPRVVPASEADFLVDDDEVLGFVLDGQARAYDVRALCYHHVVNDRIGLTLIAVTY